MEEEDLDSLTTDFNKLRSSIATQLRQVQPIDKVVEKPKKAFAETLTADLPAPPLPPAPPATVNSPPKPTPLIAMEPDDDEVPTFYALRDSLHGKVSTSEGALPPPPKSTYVPLRSPKPEGTVTMQVPPPQRENPTPGGLGTGTADSLSSEFQALRASITAKLRNATTEGIGATASKATIHALGDDDDYDEEDDTPEPPAPQHPSVYSRPPINLPAAAYEAPPEPPESIPIAPSGTVFLQRPGAGTGAVKMEPAPAYAGEPAGNTVMLSARKPGHAGGPVGVITAMDPRSAIAQAASNAPLDMQTGAAITGSVSAGMSSTHVPMEAPPNTAVLGAADREGGMGPAFDYEAALSATSHVAFGHLALKAALESHRNHYESARAKLPAMGQHRPTSGRGFKPPPPPPNVWKRKPAPGGKPVGPKLATSERARPKPEAAWADAAPADAQERLKSAAQTQAQLAVQTKKKISEISVSEATNKPKPSKPTTQKRIPISRPKTVGGVVASIGGAGSYSDGRAVGNNAPLMPVSGYGIPPTHDRIRETERLVAAVAASAKEDADTYEVAEERATLADQYTEGVKGIPMTAQQAWAAAEAGERRQKEIMAGVGGLAQAIYQSVQAEIS